MGRDVNGGKVARSDEVNLGRAELVEEARLALLPAVRNG
jgi:hypothetical protein